MPRTNEIGRDLKRVLEWTLNREVPDSELAAALGMPTATYGRRKNADDFPSFEELGNMGPALGISAVMLQIAFGLRSPDEASLLSDEDFHLYLQQGGRQREVEELLGKAASQQKVNMRPRLADVFKPVHYSRREDAGPLT